MELTPEERKRIYEEEKARIEATGKPNFEDISPSVSTTQSDPDQRTDSYAFLLVVLAIVGLIVWVVGWELSDAPGASGRPPSIRPPVAYTPPKPMTTPEVLAKATDEFNHGNLSAAVSLLRSVKSRNDPKVQNKLSEFKRTGAGRLVKQARELNRAAKYADAIGKLTEAKEYGSNDAANLLPEYRVAQARKEKESERDAWLLIERLYQGNGSVKIAVFGVELRRSTELHTVRGNTRFVAVAVSAMNMGGGIVHVNPNDFTLATRDGATMPPDSDTYGLSNYFNAVDLRPQQSTTGILLFVLNRDTRYTLSYQGFGGTAQKFVVPDPGHDR